MAYTVVQVRSGSVPGECDSVDVDLAEAEPWKNDGSGDDVLEPGIGIGQNPITYGKPKETRSLGILNS